MFSVENHESPACFNTFLTLACMLGVNLAKNQCKVAAYALESGGKERPHEISWGHPIDPTSNQFPSRDIQIAHKMQKRP